MRIEIWKNMQGFPETAVCWKPDKLWMWKTPNGLFETHILWWHETWGYPKLLWKQEVSSALKRWRGECVPQLPGSFSACSPGGLVRMVGLRGTERESQFLLQLIGLRRRDWLWQIDEDVRAFESHDFGPIPNSKPMMDCREAYLSNMVMGCLGIYFSSKRIWSILVLCCCQFEILSGHKSLLSSMIMSLLDKKWCATDWVVLRNIYLYFTFRVSLASAP